MAREAMGRICSSDPCETEKWWDELWKLKLPPKMRVFLWRAGKGWLPTAENLVNRGMDVDDPPVLKVYG